MHRGVDIVKILPHNIKKLLKVSKVLQILLLSMLQTKELMSKSKDIQPLNCMLTEKQLITVVKELQAVSLISC